MLSGLEEAYTCTEVPEDMLRVELHGYEGGKCHGNGPGSFMDV